MKKSVRSIKVCLLVESFVRSYQNWTRQASTIKGELSLFGERSITKSKAVLKVNYLKKLKMS